MREEAVEIRTSDGTADGFVFRPDTTAPLPGVIQLTDGIGIRPAHHDISRRIAAEGYAVLMPNIFYRTRRVPAFDFEPNMGEERTMTRFRELIGPLTPEAMERDAAAYVDYLAARPGVSDGPLGVVGFCLTGQFALRMAAERPDRVAAAASFHGGGLVTDTPASPHLVLPRVKARLYFGHAIEDQGMPADRIVTLGEALKAWGGQYENETYEGAHHGWTVPGSRVYHYEQAERAFAKLMDLFEGTLRAPAQV